MIHSTFWLVVGTSEYEYFEKASVSQDLPGVEGATADCQSVRDDLLAFGYSAAQVTAFCGEKMVKSEIVAAVNSMNGRLQPGDTMVVVWTGHGGGDLSDPGQRLWQAYDGVFASETDDGNGYGMSGIDPTLFESALRRNLPVDNELLFLTDTSDEGVYQGWLSLQGPTAPDFQGLSLHTRAVSPVSGGAGMLPKLLHSCLRRDMAMAEDGQISAAEAGLCLGATSNTVGITTNAAGEWASTSATLIWYPPPPVVSKVTSDDSVKARKLRPILRYGGLGTGIIAGIAGGVTFAQASAIYQDAADQNFEVDPSWQPNEERYADLRTATYVLWGVGLAGLATFGGSFVNITPAPQGVTISGSF